MESPLNNIESRHTGPKPTKHLESAFLVPFVVDTPPRASRPVMRESVFAADTGASLKPQPAETIWQRSMREFGHWREIIVASWQKATFRERLAVFVGAGLQVPAMLLHLIPLPIHLAAIPVALLSLGISPMSLLFYPACVLAFIVTSGFTYHVIGGAIMLLGPKVVRDRVIRTFKKAPGAIWNFLINIFVQNPESAATPARP